MGQHNSNVSKKLLILTFDDYYTERMYNHFCSQNKYSKISDGFINDIITIRNTKASVWFLSPENRHLWKHYYLGTQGIIIVFSFLNENIDKGVIIEVLNIFCDDNLKNVPFLFIFDKNKIQLQSDLMVKIEKIKEENTNEQCNKYFYDPVDFKKAILSDVKRGFEWLLKEMNKNDKDKDNDCDDN